MGAAECRTPPPPPPAEAAEGADTSAAPAGGGGGGNTSPKNSNISLKNHHLGTNIRYYKDFDELPDDTYVRNGQVNFDCL